MLKKGERLGRADFTTHSKHGRRYHSDSATLIFQPFPVFLGAVVVSKKVCKKAVDRNQARRRVFSILQATKKTGAVGVYLIILKPPFATLTKAQTTTHIESLIGRITKPA